MINIYFFLVFIPLFTIPTFNTTSCGCDESEFREWKIPANQNDWSELDWLAKMMMTETIHRTRCLV